MRSPTLVRALVSALAAALALALLAPGALAATRHIDGTVISKDASSRTFKLATQSGNLRIRVNAGTDFERISGFGGLHKGLAVEVDAVTTASGLLATQIETRGGGGDDGGSGGGSDDGPKHT